MAGQPVSDADIQAAADAVEAYGTKTEAARALGIPRKTLSDRYDTAKARNLTSGEPVKSEESWDQEDKDGGNALGIRSTSARLRTVDDVLDHAEIDRNQWTVLSSRVKSWEVTIKVGNPEDGFNPEVIPMFGVTVTLKRVVPQFITEAVKALAIRLPNHKPLVPKQKKPTAKKDLHMLEIALFDAHFGKLCWGEETGADYDTAIAESIYRNAVDDLLDKVSGYNIEQICYPVGNDFFHINSWKHETARGTPQDHDGRFQKVYEVGKMAIVHAIDKCLEIAPVEVLYVPGNHDRETSWYLCNNLASWYRDIKRVTVDYSPSATKYIKYGVNLIGFTHGNEQKHIDLPSIMMHDRPHDFADAQVRHWHIGHWHKKRELKFTAGDTFNSVEVKILPSLSGTDSWHYDKGYVKTPRSAEAHLWSKDKGYVGYFNAYAREE